MSVLDRDYQIIKKPVITEKAMDDSGIRNAYHFRVPLDANKVEIKRAIEALFEVRVLSVNTLRARGKYRRRGYTVGMSKPWKKAMVSLAEGQTIEVI